MENSRYGALVEAIPDLLFWISADGVFTEFAPAKDMELYVQPADFLDRHICDVLPPAVAERTIAAIKKAHGSRTTQRFEYSLDLAGATRVFEARVVPAGNEVVVLARDITYRVEAEREKDRLIAELKQALADVRTLTGLLPICAWCKRVRDDAGYCEQVEGFVTKRTSASFTHGICPTCRAEHRLSRDSTT